MVQGHIFFFLVVVVQLFTGVLANGLIMVVNAIDLIIRRKMAPLDLLLSCLATTRIILLMFVFLAQLDIFCLEKYSLFANSIAFVFFINELSLWLATWLSVFYCAKIATISHPLFLWIKMRISRKSEMMLVDTELENRSDLQEQNLVSGDSYKVN
ncbi:taste receptor type 2 member 41-like protein [Cricetulus griseus]|nr:taste receptor type 2 member 41-like protein [Cricetulus griseus]